MLLCFCGLWSIQTSLCGWLVKADVSVQTQKYPFQMVFWRLPYFHSKPVCFLSVQWQSMPSVVVLDLIIFDFMHKNIHVSVKWTCSKVGLSAYCWCNNSKNRAFMIVSSRRRLNPENSFINVQIKGQDVKQQTEQCFYRATETQCLHNDSENTLLIIVSEL